MPRIAAPLAPLTSNLPCVLSSAPALESRGAQTKRRLGSTPCRLAGTRRRPLRIRNKTPRDTLPPIRNTKEPLDVKGNAKHTFSYSSNSLTDLKPVMWYYVLILLENNSLIRVIFNQFATHRI